jgi:hypothetical protein
MGHQFNLDALQIDLGPFLPDLKIHHFDLERLPMYINHSLNPIPAQTLQAVLPHIELNRIRTELLYRLDFLRLDEFDVLG